MKIPRVFGSLLSCIFYYLPVTLALRHPSLWNNKTLGADILITMSFIVIFTIAGMSSAQLLKDLQDESN